MDKLEAFIDKIVDRNLNFGRDIIVNWILDYVSKTRKDHYKILDIGCGTGKDLVNARKIVNDKFPDVELHLYGVEYYDEYIKEAENKGIRVEKVDIEKDRLPFENEFFDIIIANQIIEHIKEIFWVFSEFSRVVKKSGRIIIGVPNLASLHNRIFLLFGQQPTCIRVLGPHVRGFTIPSFREFVEADGYFKIIETKGSNFYPFPPPLSKILSSIFTSMSVGLFFNIERTEKDGTFIHVLDTRFYQTNYFKGPDNDN